MKANSEGGARSVLNEFEGGDEGSFDDSEEEEEEEKDDGEEDGYLDIEAVSQPSQTHAVPSNNGANDDDEDEKSESEESEEEEEEEEEEDEEDEEEGYKSFPALLDELEATGIQDSGDSLESGYTDEADGDEKLQTEFTKLKKSTKEKIVKKKDSKNNSHSNNNSQNLSSTSSTCLDIDEIFKNGEGTKGFDWNEEFQSLVDEAYFKKFKRDQIENLHHETTVEEKYEISIKLKKLCVDFAEEGEKIGVQIVKEMFIPVEEKTIKPITKTVGGVAGGEKYLCKSIFFKFPYDFKGIYGGDNFATKTAEHELKGTMAIFDCRVEGLYVPLMSLINYRGYSLIAQSCLPIGRNTIVYGTPDAGKNIYASDEQFNAKMKAVGEIINIKEHRIWNKAKDKSVVLYGPADLEGHIGFDGRAYVLDCARLFPPSAPDRSMKSSHLFRLFRPEFIKRYSKPLSSDAFSALGKNSDSDTHNSEIYEANEYLLKYVIPSFIELLDKINTNKPSKKGNLEISTTFFSSSGGSNNTNVDNIPNCDMTNVISSHDSPSYSPELLQELPQLIVDMHLHGINVRYLLYLLGYVKSRKSKILIASELMARSLKNFLRQKWRELKLVDLQSCYDDSPYKRIIAQYFNIIFVDKMKIQFWSVEIPKIIRDQHFPVPPAETMPQITQIMLNLRVWVSELLLFYRLQELLGLQIQFDPLLSGSGSGCKDNFEKPFTVEDILKIEPKVKYINRIMFEEGTALSRLAVSMIDKNLPQSMALLDQACERYKESLAVRPNDMRALYNWGLSLSIQASHSSPDKSKLLFKEAAKKYQDVLIINPTEYKAVFWMANLMTDRSKIDTQNTLKLLIKACKLYNRAIEMMRISSHDQQFDIYYNAGISFLRLSDNIIRSSPILSSSNLQLISQICEYHISHRNNNNNDSPQSGGENKIVIARKLSSSDSNDINLRLLEIAGERFARCTELDKSSHNALHNLAVTYAKIARMITHNDIDREEIYQKAYITYQSGYDLNPANFQLLFDWGNALYRNATSLLPSSQANSPSSSSSSVAFFSSTSLTSSSLPSTSMKAQLPPSSPNFGAEATITPPLSTGDQTSKLDLRATDKTQSSGEESSAQNVRQNQSVNRVKVIHLLFDSIEKYQMALQKSVNFFPALVNQGMAFIALLPLLPKRLTMSAGTTDSINSADKESSLHKCERLTQTYLENLENVTDKIPENSVSICIKTILQIRKVFSRNSKLTDRVNSILLKKFSFHSQSNEKNSILNGQPSTSKNNNNNNSSSSKMKDLNLPSSLIVHSGTVHKTQSSDTSSSSSFTPQPLPSTNIILSPNETDRNENEKKSDRTNFHISSECKSMNEVFEHAQLAEYNRRKLSAPPKLTSISSSSNLSPSSPSSSSSALSSSTFTRSMVGKTKKTFKKLRSFLGKKSDIPVTPDDIIDDDVQPPSPSPSSSSSHSEIIFNVNNNNQNTNNSNNNIKVEENTKIKHHKGKSQQSKVEKSRSGSNQVVVAGRKSSVSSVPLTTLPNNLSKVEKVSLNWENVILYSMERDVYTQQYYFEISALKATCKLLKDPFYILNFILKNNEALLLTSPSPTTQSNSSDVIHDFETEKSKKKKKKYHPSSTLLPSPPPTSVSSPQGENTKSSISKFEYLMSYSIDERFWVKPEEISVLQNIPFIVRLHCIFHIDGKIHFLFDYFGVRFFPFFTSQFQNQQSVNNNNNHNNNNGSGDDNNNVNIKISKLYLAELFLCFHELSQSNQYLSRFNPNLLFLSPSGHIRLLHPFGFCKSSLGKEEEANMQLNITNIMYTSPESLRGSFDLNINHWWIFGMLAYQIITRKQPFNNDLQSTLQSLMMHSSSSSSSSALFKDLHDHISEIELNFLTALLSPELHSRLLDPHLIFTHPFFTGVDWRRVISEDYAVSILPSDVHHFNGVNPCSIDYANLDLAVLSSSSSSADLSEGYGDDGGRFLDTLLAPDMKNHQWCGNTLLVVKSPLRDENN